MRPPTILGLLLPLLAARPCGAQSACRAWTDGLAEPGLPLATVYDGTAAASDFDGTLRLYVAGGTLPGTSVRASRLLSWDGAAWQLAFAPPALPTPVSSTLYRLTPLVEQGQHVLYVAELRSGVDHVLWRGDSGGWSAIGHFNERIVSLCWHDDGNGPALFVGGAFQFESGQFVNHVTRWDGASWSMVGGGLYEVIGALTEFDAGTGVRLYAGQLSPDPWIVSLMVWDGVSWSVAPGGLQRAVNALRVFDDGTGAQLYAGGLLHNPGLGIQYLARFDGSSWSPVGALDGAVLDLEVGDLGAGPRLFVGGQFFHDGLAQVRRAAQWDGNALSELAGGVDGELHTLAPLPGSTPRLFACGTFGSVGGAAGGGARRIASFDGTRWSALGRGLDKEVDALARFDDGTGEALYAGGSFDLGGDSPYLGRVARWNGSGWTPLGSLSGSVLALAGADLGAGAQLFAAGDFHYPGWGVALWNGTAWSDAGGGVHGPCLALCAHDDGAGTRLFAGGEYTLAAGGPADFVSAWDGTSWSALGSGTNGTVAALAEHDEGAGALLFAGGTFTSAGGVQADHIARWDGQGWTNVGRGLDGGVNALASFDDGHGAQLYAGGTFTHAGNVSVGHLARWDGSNWSELPGGGADGAVLALCVHDDGRGPALYVAGGFAHIGGIEAFDVARFDGASWEALGSGADNAVLALASVDDDGDGDRELWLGGRFLAADERACGHVARWSGCPHYESICAGDGSLVDHTTPCPCANDGAPGHGCANSVSAGGALLTASGSTFVDDVRLASAFEPASSFTLFLQHDAPADTLFHDGVLCAGGTLIRLRGRNALSGQASFPNALYDGSITLSQRGGVIPGQGATRSYSAFYRNASTTFCPPAAANVTNGIRVVW